MKRPKIYTCAVWATQGGGLAKHIINDLFAFVTAPDDPSLSVGDYVHL